MKLQCVLKDSENFKFRSTNKLRIFGENLVGINHGIVADTAGELFHKRYTLRGWNVDGCMVSSGKRVYQTVLVMGAVKRNRI
jgi:hypothetical protein